MESKDTDVVIWISVSAPPFFRLFVLLPLVVRSFGWAWAQAFARVGAPRAPLVKKKVEAVELRLELLDRERTSGS